MEKYVRLNRCLLFLFLWLMSFGVLASDAEGEFHGYFRAGAGVNSGHGTGPAQQCFALQGVPKYRLGNECDDYGEFGYTKEIMKSSDGISYVGTFMFSEQNSNAAVGDAKFSLAQTMLEVKHLEGLRDGTFWVGQRYYKRPDIHILDFKYIDLDGVGAGIDDVPVGPGKFSYAMFRADLNNKSTSVRHNFIYSDVPVNDQGKLDIYTAFIRANRVVADHHDGWSLSLIHTQKNLLQGGNNVLGFQYGNGAGVGNSALQMGTAGDVSNGSDIRRVRIFDSIDWQLTPKWGGTASVVVQNDKSPAGTQTWTTVGGRTSYAMTERTKLLFELGHDQIKPESGAVQQLNKVTLAFAIAKAMSFWARPEIRLFVTYATWNEAAQAAATTAAPGSTLSTTGAFGSQLHGQTAGIQIESWF